MSNTPVISVDVNDSQFKAFYELFQRYSADVEELPAEWKKIDGATRDAGKAIVDFTKHTKTSTETLLDAALHADEIGSSIVDATKAQKEFLSVARNGSSELKKMSDHAKSLGSEVFGIGKFLMKLGAIGGGVAGLGGIIGALSLRGIAESAVSTQRSARGLGMTPGQLTAFNQDLGNYVDPSVLGSVANAQGSYAGRMWLARAAGMSMDQVAGMETGQLTGNLALKAHDWWANTPASMRTSEFYQTTGLAQSGIPFEMARQQGNTPRADILQGMSQYGSDQRRLNVSDGNSKAWYDFLRQIENAGNTIEKGLTNKLATLSGPLQYFIDAFGKDAMKLVDDIFTAKNLQSLEDGINSLTDYLGSPQFGQDIKTVAAGFGALAKAIGKAGVITENWGDQQQAAPYNPNAPISSNLTPDQKYAAAQNSSDMQIGSAFGYVRHKLTMPRDPKAVLASIEKSNGLPPGMLSGMWGIESSNGSRLVGQPTKTGERAIGDFQFMSDAWNQYGNGGDRWNFNDEANGAGRQLSALRKHYNGDMRKAVAAYDWGVGNVDKDVSRNGAQWESHLPFETRAYLSKITAALAQKSTVNLKVDVRNNTAARVAMSTNAAGTGS